MAQVLSERIAAAPCSERAVFAALRDHLSDDWSVWHSVRYSAARTGTEGEVDFLAAHPRLGVVVIEVKGGAIACRDGKWFQDNRPLDESPATQATRNAHALIRAYRARYGANPPYPLVHAICFTAAERPTVEPIEVEGITIYADDLPRIEEVLTRLLERSVRSVREPVDIERLKALLTPTVIFKTGWHTRCELQNSIIAQLTEEQARAFDMFRNFRRFRVRGCAGSGKTFLALRQASLWAAEGKHVLLLCFNLLLAEQLRKITARQPNIRAIAINDLLCELLDRRPDGTADFWHRLSADAPAAVAALAKKHTPYDAVIVDEGQDFDPNQWAAVQALTPPYANFLIFYDPEQNVFDRDLRAMPDFGGSDPCLNVNCRNTQSVFATLRPYAPQDVRPDSHAPVGETTEVYHAENVAASRARLRSILARLIFKENIPASDIIILGANRQDKMELDAVLHDFAGVRYYTYRKFKGLEAPILILLDVCDNPKLWGRTARYTAISRAIHRLFIIELIPPQSAPASNGATI